MEATPSLKFGDLLRRYRLAAGLTQEELAERAQVSPRAISDLERGARSRPWRETIQLLVDALGLAQPERVALEASARLPRAPVAVGTLEKPANTVSRVGRTNLPNVLAPLVGRDDL